MDEQATKAISIRQPWAWAIIHAGKRVENRRWDPHSGNAAAARRLVGQTILIHAAKGCPGEEFDDGVDAVLDAARPAPGAERLAFLSTLAKMSVALRGKHHGEGTWRPVEGLPFGALVATAKLADVYEGGFLGHRRHDFGRCSLCGQENPSQNELIRGAPLGGGQCPKRDPWAIDGSLWLILDDVKPLPEPIPFKGSLGFFEVPAGVVEVVGHV